MPQVRTGVLADCTREEFDRRLRRLREEMARTGVDGLLLTQESNVRYATGWYEVCWVIQAYFWMAFIPRDENLPPMLIIPSGGHNQTQASWIETLAVWEFPIGFYTGNVGGATVDAVVALVKDLGLSEAHIATETGAHFRMGMSVEMFDSLRDALPGARWSDCGKVIWPVRSVKSDEEVRRLRESVRITCLGIQAGFEAISDGVSEREVASIMSQEMHARGGSEIRSLILYAGPDRALWSDSIPRREMIIRPGSLIQFDGGGTYEGYYTDIKRFASLGQPTADQQRYYDWRGPPSRPPSTRWPPASRIAKCTMPPSACSATRDTATSSTGASVPAGPPSVTTSGSIFTRCPASLPAPMRFCSLTRLSPSSRTSTTTASSLSRR